MIEVRAYPRIHMGLLDLGHATFRAYGGAGFMVDGLPVVVRRVDDGGLEISSTCKLDSDAISDLERLKSRIQYVVPTASGVYQVISMPPQHIGLGSKTALMLALVKCIDESNKFGWDQETIGKLSGRGGASGIGVNGFFCGGFLVDGGHSNTPSNYAPSSSREGEEIPPLMIRLPFPACWNVHFILPPGQLISGRHEKEFFSANTPIPQEEVLEAVSLTYHGIAPAFALGDLEVLRKAIMAFHKIGFKSRELQSQPNNVQTTFAALQERIGYPVGLSSLGPLIYLIGNKRDMEVEKALEKLSQEYGFAHFGWFSGRNSGFEVSS